MYLFPPRSYLGGFDPPRYFFGSIDEEDLFAAPTCSEDFFFPIIPSLAGGFDRRLEAMAADDLPSKFLIMDKDELRTYPRDNNFTEEYYKEIRSCDGDLPWRLLRDGKRKEDHEEIPQTTKRLRGDETFHRQAKNGGAGDHMKDGVLRDTPDFTSKRLSGDESFHRQTKNGGAGDHMKDGVLRDTPDSSDAPSATTKRRDSTCISGIRISEEDLRSVQSGRYLNDNCLNAMLELICRDRGDGVYAVSSYFYPHLTSGGGWAEARRYFRPPEGEGDGKGSEKKWDSRSSIPIDCNKLLVPIITGKHKMTNGHFEIVDGHWTIVLRAKAARRGSSGGTPSYRFFYFDTFNDVRRMETIMRDLDRTEVYDAERDGPDAWTLQPCAPQTEAECGPRAALAAALALWDGETMGAAAQVGLGEMDALAERCRSWVEASITAREMKPIDWAMPTV